MTTEQQKAYNFDFTVGGQAFTINEQTTIKELDEALIALNRMLAGEHELQAVKRRIYEFMRQHHSFDLYIDEMKPVKR